MFPNGHCSHCQRGYMQRLARRLIGQSQGRTCLTTAPLAVAGVRGVLIVVASSRSGRGLLQTKSSQLKFELNRVNESSQVKSSEANSSQVKSSTIIMEKRTRPAPSQVKSSQVVSSRV